MRQQYYANIADGCDALLTMGPLTNMSDMRKLALDKERLPPAIHELNPSRIAITTNSVLLRIGEGWDSYGITWRESEEKKGTWILGAYNEGDRRDLFSRTKLSNSKPKQGTR